MDFEGPDKGSIVTVKALTGHIFEPSRRRLCLALGGVIFERAAQIPRPPTDRINPIGRSVAGRPGAARSITFIGAHYHTHILG
jgi:hypothetical protein